MELLDGVHVSRTRAGIGEVRRLLEDIAMLEAGEDPPPDAIEDTAYYARAVADCDTWGAELAAHRDATQSPEAAAAYLELLDVETSLVNQAVRIARRSGAEEGAHVARLEGCLRAAVDRRAAHHDPPHITSLRHEETASREALSGAEAAARAAVDELHEEPLCEALKTRFAILLHPTTAAGAQ
eukprot:TRINITY_DN33374_c0_g1_i1.p2 TRINITY_DN33374_c0_g1~~TRINITY_DN33374_c0_g1_i1.p2  ORF type:complete len:183 (+),score=57.11 TRINITY_DN33374_c0_g1_i1:71-619(+)